MADAQGIELLTLNEDDLLGRAIAFAVHHELTVEEMRAVVLENGRACRITPRFVQLWLREGECALAEQNELKANNTHIEPETSIIVNSLASDSDEEGTLALIT